ncbi:CASP-like protein 1B1 [Cornus florida]|uniref:CASP-like protein 1B1 n=1 Tax=Cornus florida TaxID=4283 RepID=UPI00289C1FC3|nr:CASP-like protein 1B1 [Cornus florida]
MASEGGEKAEVGCNQVVVVGKPKGWVIEFIPLVRIITFFATVSATIVMALNKETKTLVVATIGSTPINVTLTAKFQHTPAFVFFVIANGMASFHNMLMLVADFIGDKFDYKGFRFVIIAVLDMMVLGLVSGGASAAAFMGELGRNGNSHARWNKICDNFHTFCDHGSGALIASFIGLLLLIIINVMSIIRLHYPNSINNSVVP